MVMRLKAKFSVCRIKKLNWFPRIVASGSV